MKKLLALLLVGAMSLSMVACGGAKEEAAAPAATEEAAPEAEVEAPAEEAGDAAVAADITLWTYPVGKFNDSATVDEIVAAFNAVYPDVNVSVEYLDYTSGDDQVTAAIEAGTTPDIKGRSHNREAHSERPTPHLISSKYAEAFFCLRYVWYR